MNIVIFGASGKVGRLATNEALKRGHHVTAFVHSTSLQPAENLEIVQGDVKSVENVQTALSGADVVISALGSWGTPSKDILGSAMSVIVPLMQGLGINRIVSLTGNVAFTPHQKPSMAMKIARLGLSLVGSKILRDGEKHLALLDQSGLNWTALRSPVMTGSARRTYTLTEQAGFHNFVPRMAVAIALVDIAESSEWNKQAPFIH